MPVEPIRPEQVAERKADLLPDFVMEAFNDLIAKHMSGRTAHVKQRDVVAEIKRRDLGERDPFVEKWLDVEDIYRAVGWKVRYDKPAYNENYDAYFEFTKP